MLACLAALTLLAQPAAAQKSADTLRIAWRDALSSVDPYYSQLRASLVLSHQAWDSLVYRDPETFQIKPLLALSWKLVDPMTYEFELRRDAVFHDGSPFTADDVVYTINTVIADPAVAVPDNYAYLAGAERIDDFHVRVRLKRVFPAALEYMAITLPMLPKAYRERVGADAYGLAPVGTGPYRITRIDGITEIDLERNDAYFEGPKAKPAIAHLQIREIPDAAAVVTELLGGDADWIWGFNADQFDTINRNTGLQAVRVESMRIGYLAMDAAGRTTDGKPGVDNPLTKQKVRQAIAYAIDRAALARLLGLAGGRVLDAACYPTQFGCDQTSPMHYGYDPAMAHKLLTEAGYPDGFDTELVAYVLPQTSAAIQGYLKAVGINATLTQLTTRAAVARSVAGRAPLYAGTWGSYSVNDVSAILPFFFGGGANDDTRDPELTKLVEQGGSTVDPDERRRDYSAALRRISEQMDWLPLNAYSTAYAFTRQLNFKAFPDELPRFFMASWR